MKLWQLFKELPLPLLISSLALVCTALPVASVELAQLTPDNFKSSVASGVWFIEHFSPYCGHCRAFAPTWEELVKYNDEHAELSIKLAQVNCAVHGDLCDSNGVKGYPQINLYKDGEFVETFKGARELSRLTDFLKNHAPSQAPAPAPVDVKQQQLEELEPEISSPGVIPSPSGTVLALDDETFQKTVDQGPVFIKFFAPWCGHCKKLAPTWKNLAKSMQNKLTIAEVDCEAHKALCKTENIEGFPTLKFFTGGTKSEYNGGRKLEQLREFAEKASGSISKAVTAIELEKHISEEKVVYALLYPSTQRGILSALKPLFAPLLGSPTVYTVVDPPHSLTSRLSIPDGSWSLVSFKDHDFTHPTSIYTSTLTPFSLSDTTNTEAISKWLLYNRLPTTLELTQDTFQSIMNAPSRPLVVLAAVTKENKDRVQERLEELGSKWRSRTEGTGCVRVDGGGSRPVVFAWMDLERWKDWMKSMYGLGKKDEKGLEDVDVVITDHQSLIYYDVDTTNAPIKLTSSQSIFTSIEGAANGRIKAKNSENLIERTARYLNSKLIAIETYIINNPMHAFFFVLGILGVVFLAVRKLLADDTMDHEYGRLSKGERLD